MELVGMNLVDRVVACTLLTGWIKDERPVNLLIVAPPSAGKTHTILSYITCKGVVHLSEFTPYGFMRDYYNDFKNGRYRFILISDLGVALGNALTRGTVISFLLDLIEHGVINISKYWKEGEKFGFTPVEVKVGMIAASTMGFISDKRKKWLYATGFLDRFLYLSYSYDKELLDVIYERLFEGRPKLTFKQLPIPDGDVEVRYPPSLGKRLRPLIEHIANKQGSYGIRLINHSRALLKANALLNGRDEVTEDDVADVWAYLTYMNLGLTPIRPFEEVRENVIRNTSVGELFR